MANKEKRLENGEMVRAFLHAKLFLGEDKELTDEFLTEILLEAGFEKERIEKARLSNSLISFVLGIMIGFCLARGELLEPWNQYPH